MTTLTGARSLVALIVRRDRWLVALWVLLLGIYPLLMVLAQESVIRTVADRESFVATIAVNPGLLMLYGPAHGPSAGALGVWAAGDAWWIVGLVSVLTVIRHTRTDEEAGRRELLGATVVGRQAGMAAALTVVLVANLALAFVVALATMGRGLPVGGSIALGLSLAGTGWIFAALAAAAAQLTESAAGARSIAVAGLGLAWLLRAVGDAGGGDGPVSWMAWLSPISWTRQIRPYGGEQWWIFALVIGVVVVLTATAAALSARRDIGAGVLPARLGPARASARLRSPLALAWRLHRGRIVGWAIGFAVFGGVLSASAKSAGDLFRASTLFGDMFKAVGSGTDPSDIFLSAIMGMLGLLAGAYAVTAALRIRSEEVEGRAEPVLAASVGRLNWTISHLAFSFLGPAVALAAAGAAGGLVYGLSVGEVGRELPRVLAGALVQLPAVWVLSGVTVALFGLLPRFAVGGWVPLGVFVLIWVVQMSVPLDPRLLDLSPFFQVPQLPGATVDAAPLVGLIAVSVAFAAAGLLGLRRRDIGRT